jgi:beta-N-acetylhexosaminidase
MDITGFSKEQLAGQRLMVGFDGTELNDDLRFLIDTVKVGGLILFARNLIGPDQIRELCASVQSYAADCGQPSLLIAIDQEGGQVARLKEPFTQFPGNPAMKGEADAVEFARITARELSGVGINMNMAPVMDAAPENEESVMAKRVFGTDPLYVAAMGVKVIEHLQAGGIMAVAKHFPGIGRTVLDSHNDLPIFEAEMADMESFDLLPFQAAVRAGAAGMMLSHILYTKLDPEWPASLSPRIAKELLRNQMGFDGLVMTDDLDMGAVKKHYEMKSIIRQILQADIDIALICHKGPDIETAFEMILKFMEDSQKMESRMKDSVKRILRIKDNYINNQEKII